MWKKINTAVLLVGLYVFSFYTSTPAVAAPSAPAEVVNHTTKECAEIFTGDECESCVPADGCEFLSGDCPDEYTVLDQWAPSTCTFYASQYCCESRANSDAGCDTPPSFTKFIPIGSVLILTTIIGVILLFRHKKRIGPN